jgi:antitoxin PrlF
MDLDRRSAGMRHLCYSAAMSEEIAQLSGRGTVTLPASLRRSLGLSEGDVFTVRVDNGAVVLTPAIVTEIERYTDEREREFRESAAMSDDAIADAAARWKGPPTA